MQEKENIPCSDPVPVKCLQQPSASGKANCMPLLQAHNWWVSVPCWVKIRSASQDKLCDQGSSRPPSIHVDTCLFHYIQ